jgi:uncharacterized membrane protein
MGLIMGLINLIAWYTTKAASPIAPIFQNPLICVLPRVLIAVVSYWSRRGLEALILKKWMKIESTPQVAIDDDEDANDETVLVECEITETTLDNAQIDIQTTDCDNIAEIEDNDECMKDVVINDTEDTPTQVEISKADKAKKAKEIGARQAIHLVSTALGVITNTLFVAIFTLIFFNNTTLGGTIINVEYILAWFGLNFAIEVVAFSLITPPITLAIKAAKLA